MNFGCLTSYEGEKFRKDCQAAGKKIMVWTVNDPQCMVEAARWNIDVIITDTPKTWLDLRSALAVDYDKIVAQHSRLFLWTTWQFYPPFQLLMRKMVKSKLEEVAGPFVMVDTNAVVGDVSMAKA